MTHLRLYGLEHGRHFPGHVFAESRGRVTRPSLTPACPCDPVEDGAQRAVDLGLEGVVSAASSSSKAEAATCSCR